jgi:hypothetical protein
MKHASLPLLGRREFIMLLGGAAARRRGRLRGGRSRANGCGASVCWLASPKLIQR